MKGTTIVKQYYSKQLIMKEVGEVPEPKTKRPSFEIPPSLKGEQ